MSRLENLGPTGEPISDVPTGEFVEIGARPRTTEHIISEESTSLSELWDMMPRPLKVILGTAPVWLIALCSAVSSAPPPPELKPEQLVRATDMAEVAGGSEAAGTPLYLDDLPGDAGEACAGKFIWAFNLDGETGTVSLRDEQGTSITSGKYQLSDQNLSLTGLVERRPGGIADKAAKNVTYHIGRTAEGRIIIGTKDYRRCEPVSDAPENRPAASPPPAAPPPMAQYDPQPIAAAPPPNLTPDQACERLSGELAGLLSENSQGVLKVIEASASTGMSRVRDDGTLSCYGSAITNHGTLVGFFGTSVTPKGQVIINWRVDEAATKIANIGL